MLILDKRRALERIMALMAAPDAGVLAEAVLKEGAGAAPSGGARPGRVAVYEPRPPAAAWGIAATSDDAIAASETAARRRERRRRRSRAADGPSPA
jgi:hypothetical protein